MLSDPERGTNQRRAGASTEEHFVPKFYSIQHAAYETNRIRVEQWALLRTIGLEAGENRSTFEGWLPPSSSVDFTMPSKPTLSRAASSSAATHAHQVNTILIDGAHSITLSFHARAYDVVPYPAPQTQP